MQKRVGPKRVKVFEAGAGGIATGILGQAIRAQKKRVGREFIASDIALLKEATLRQRGLSQNPSNLKLIKNCSIAELKKLPKESMDLVFESFFVNKYSYVFGGYFEKRKVEEYFKEAKRVLKKGGRIILIQSHLSAELFRDIAKGMGLKAHLAIIPDKILATSSSEWINKRSTPSLRKKFMWDYARDHDPDSIEASMRFADERGLMDASDTHRPVALIVRK